VSNAPDPSTVPESIAREAAEWVLRSDRGLTAAEQDDFSHWLAADPRHGAQLARHRRHWQRLDQLAQWLPEHSTRPNPDLLAPPLRRRLVRFVPVSLVMAAAAALAVVFFWQAPRPGPATPPPTVAETAPAANTTRLLEDGSVVELNRGAELTVLFTPGERRVKLERGEAHFAVTKNAERPFIVTAHGVDVRAVGTAFNVRLDTASVEVLVTEGKVRLADSAVAAVPAAPAPVENVLIPLLEARQRAVVSISSRHHAAQVATLTLGEIDRVLAWQHRMLDFSSRPLAEIVGEFNRRNVRQIIVTDGALAAETFSGVFRSDNIDSFLSFLEKGCGATVERRGDTEIYVRKAR
jgi:transmembrane sensor